MPAKKKNDKKKNPTPEQRHIEEWEKKYQELEEQNTSLQKEIEEMQQTTKRAQYDYVNLKMDFDRYMQKNEEAKSSQKLELLLDTVKKFLPFVENLRKSLENISDEVQETPLGKGVTMVYNKFLTTLETMHIKPIEAVGLEPDSMLHEPVSVQPTDDKKLKGKIVQEFERGFVYENGDIQKVVVTSKVVVGQ